MSMVVPDGLRFDERGLIPAIAQDAENGQVLMVAAMDREALNRTVATGLAHYYSRSRGRVWQKGEDSGHVQRVRGIRYDCDADALLLAVDQEVAACHTGNRSCFYRAFPGGDGELEGEARAFDPAQVYGGLPLFDGLAEVIEGRRAQAPEGSYVGSLFAKGQDHILKKVAEEAAEVLVACKNPERAAVVYEMADLWFHSLVLLAFHGIAPREVAQELGRRFGKRKGDY